MINSVRSEYMRPESFEQHLRCCPWHWRKPLYQLHGNGVTAERVLVSASITIIFPHLLWHPVQISQNQSRQSGSLIITMNRKCI